MVKGSIAKIVSQTRGPPVGAVVNVVLVAVIALLLLVPSYRTQKNLVSQSVDQSSQWPQTIM